MQSPSHYLNQRQVQADGKAQLPRLCSVGLQDVMHGFFENAESMLFCPQGPDGASGFQCFRGFDQEG